MQRGNCLLKAVTSFFIIIRFHRAFNLCQSLTLSAFKSSLSVTFIDVTSHYKRIQKLSVLFIYHNDHYFKRGLFKKK